MILQRPCDALYCFAWAKPQPFEHEIFHTSLPLRLCAIHYQQLWDILSRRDALALEEFTTLHSLGALSFAEGQSYLNNLEVSNDHSLTRTT